MVENQGSVISVSTERSPWPYKQHHERGNRWQNSPQPIWCVGQRKGNTPSLLLFTNPVSYTMRLEVSVFNMQHQREEEPRKIAN
ncbi:hypothetical protein Pcinc_029204 [Petrolisthes cinctipes]|uniref:Uncharacterized protein n=1 Tax=Petrolisthes cinctipes TaxID=88211 RepID=A0AAE1K488_PETCI|nr:hypothetical protein Pcinc_029204 [Petrolisthes cinctipes]